MKELFFLLFFINGKDYYLILLNLIISYQLFIILIYKFR